MWVAKFRIKHICLISDRCKKFKCTSISIPLGNWIEKRYYYTMHTHTLSGDQKNINKFIADLKKDKEVVHIDVVHNTVYLTSRKRVPDQISANYNQKMFFVKPIYVDLEGWEHCEFGAWEKKTLMEAINNVKNQQNTMVKIEKFTHAPVETIHYPRALPNLSPKQKQAFNLALQEGYYNYPRKVDLLKLAKMMKVTVSTFQEHLRKAEAKILPAIS